MNGWRRDFWLPAVHVSANDILADEEPQIIVENVDAIYDEPEFPAAAESGYDRFRQLAFRYKRALYFVLLISLTVSTVMVLVTTNDEPRLEGTMDARLQRLWKPYVK